MALAARASCRHGFTLAEVMVALTLGALVILLAHRVYGGVLDASRSLSGAREALDRGANARRLLSTLVGSIEVGSPTAAFSGGASAIAFSAWRTGGRGSPELRRITIDAGDGALTLNGLAEGPVRLADSVVALGVDYLLDLSADARWMHGWESAQSAPAAIRIRIGRPTRTDTLLLIIGPRG